MPFKIQLRSIYAHFRLHFMELKQIVVVVVLNWREDGYCGPRVAKNRTTYSAYKKDLLIPNTIIFTIKNPLTGVCCVDNDLDHITNSNNVVFVHRKPNTIVYSA